MSPPAALRDFRWQSSIAILLSNLLPHGLVLTECPLSTADGVKTIGVQWLIQVSVVRGLVDSPSRFQ
jgi:hypothetical protein